jgi:cell division protein FtsB
LNREQAYGDLLGRIAESEKKIEYLKRKNETLKSNLQKLKDEVQVMEMTGKTSKKGVETDVFAIVCNL